MTSECLFVYGSLKRGGQHHAELRGARFLGLAVTEPGYRLGLGPPGTSPTGAAYLALERERGGTDSVAGELYQVNDALLAELDVFEGEQYCRAVVQVIVEDSLGKRDALAYLKRTG